MWVLNSLVVITAVVVSSSVVVGSAVLVGTSRVVGLMVVTMSERLDRQTKICTCFYLLYLVVVQYYNVSKSTASIIGKF